MLKATQTKSYLTDCCTPISDVASRLHLRSASRRQLLVQISPHMVVGLFLSRVRLPGTARMCDELREPLLTANSFRQLLKIRLFAEY